MRSIKRCPVTKLTDAVRAQIDAETFFGSTGFANVWDANGGQAVCWMVMESGNLCAALVGVEFRPIPFTRLQMMPSGCYARMVADTESIQERRTLAELLMSAIEKHGYAKVIISDYFKELGIGERSKSKEYETLVVDISNPAWLPPDQKLQSEIRKAEREGVTIASFDCSKHLDSFMDLVKRTDARHRQSLRYSREFYLRLAELAERDNRIRWYFVEHEGNPVLSHIYFVEGTTALNWQICYNKEFSHLKANQYLMFTTARSLAQAGVKYLNLGASPPDAEGLRAYKEKWGGVSYRYPIATHTTWLGRLL